MINANLSQFLDTEGYNEATLYLNGYTYWCEGCWFKARKNLFIFLYKYHSVVHNDGSQIWTTRLIENNDVVDYSTVFDVWGSDEEEVKNLFLNAKIFDGKSFGEIENELAWYDEL